MYGESNDITFDLESIWQVKFKVTQILKALYLVNEDIGNYAGEIYMYYFSQTTSQTLKFKPIWLTFQIDDNWNEILKCQSDDRLM